jgi:chlorobactene lauroyltransferase
LWHKSKSYKGLQKLKMLTAKKSLGFEKIFAIYCSNLFKRRFHDFKVSGLDFLQNRDKNIPTIIYCNHSSWWDGFAAFQISNKLKTDSFIMMEEKQLKNLRLFRKLGAFSVIRENPREAVRSIKYAADLLKEEQDRILWLFPQGKIQPNDLRPIKFYNGISRIIEKAEKCLTFSMAIRYEFLGEYKPQIFVKITESELINVDKTFNSKIQTERFEVKLIETLSELKEDIIFNKLETYKSIM